MTATMLSMQTCLRAQRQKESNLWGDILGPLKSVTELPLTSVGILLIHFFVSVEALITLHAIRPHPSYFPRPHIIVRIKVCLCQHKKHHPLVPFNFFFFSTAPRPHICIVILESINKRQEKTKYDSRTMEHREALVQRVDQMFLLSGRSWSTLHSIAALAKGHYTFFFSITET